jgi:hypothetical protein
MTLQAGNLTLKEQYEAIRVGMTVEQVREITPYLFFPYVTDRSAEAILAQQCRFGIFPKRGMRLLFVDGRLQEKTWYGLTLERTLRHWGKCASAISENLFSHQETAK